MSGTVLAQISALLTILSLTPSFDYFSTQDKKSEFAKNIEEMRNMFTAETATFEKMFKEFSTQTEQANKRMAEEVGPVMQVRPVNSFSALD